MQKNESRRYVRWRKWVELLREASDHPLVPEYRDHNERSHNFRHYN